MSMHDWPSTQVVCAQDFGHLCRGLRASTDDVAAVVSYDGEVFRVEAGPAAEYFRDEDEAD